jgi:hypothetical protein
MGVAVKIHNRKKGCSSAFALEVASEWFYTTHGRPFVFLSGKHL